MLSLSILRVNERVQRIPKFAQEQRDKHRPSFSLAESTPQLQMDRAMTLGDKIEQAFTSIQKSRRRLPELALVKRSSCIQAN